METLTLLRLGILWVYDWEIQIRKTMRTLFEPPVVILISLHQNNDKTPGVSWIDEELSAYGSLGQLPRHQTYPSHLALNVKKRIANHISLYISLPLSLDTESCEARTYSTFLLNNWKHDIVQGEIGTFFISIWIAKEWSPWTKLVSILIAHGLRRAELLIKSSFEDKEGVEKDAPALSRDNERI